MVIPDRPQNLLTIGEDERVDFDEALLPEDSWVGDLTEDKFEVERITSMRSG